MRSRDGRRYRSALLVRLTVRESLGLFLRLSFLVAFPLGAEEIRGIVSHVHDGDTLTLADAHATYKIRLVDIDAPELRQARGEESRDSLIQLCRSKDATAEITGKDRYRRLLGRLTCSGVNANAEQVRQGWAWVFVRYAPKDSPLYGVESEARLEKRGLWADDKPVPPWVWRSLRRSDVGRKNGN